MALDVLWSLADPPPTPPPAATPRRSGIACGCGCAPATRPLRPPAIGEAEGKAEGPLGPMAGTSTVDNGRLTVAVALAFVTERRGAVMRSGAIDAFRPPRPCEKTSAPPAPVAELPLPAADSNKAPPPPATASAGCEAAPCPAETAAAAAPRSAHCLSTASCRMIGSDDANAARVRRNNAAFSDDSPAAISSNVSVAGAA